MRIRLKIKRKNTRFRLNKTANKIKTKAKSNIYTCIYLNFLIIIFTLA
jgi:hypothetical protein